MNNIKYINLLISYVHCMKLEVDTHMNIMGFV